MSNEEKIKRAEKREERKQGRETRRKAINTLKIIWKFFTGGL